MEDQRQKTKSRFRVLLLIATFFLLFLLLSGGRAEAASGKWKKTAGGRRYVYVDGTYAKSRWIKVNDKYYYLNARGYMLTGWRTIGGKRYYLNDNGVRQTGWKTISEKRYYFGKNGVMRTGWQNISGKRYYFGKNGVMRTGWKTIDGKKYYFNTKGVLARDEMLGDRYVNQDGAWTFTYQKPDYEVMDYFKKPLCRVVSELNALGSDWDSFVVASDFHGNWDRQHSQAVIRYLLENSSAKKCFLLGDYNLFGYQYSASKYFEQYTKSLLPVKDQIYATIGNHDRQSGNEYDKSYMKVVYDTFLADKDYLKGDPEDYYFYFDIPEKKLRYLVLSTSNHPESQRRMTEEELEWLQQDALVLPGEDWTVMAMGHIDMDPDITIRYKGKHKDAPLVAHLLANCNGNVAGYISGHQHQDYQSYVKDSFYQTVVNCDFYQEGMEGRSVGNETEQTVTVVSVNTKTGEVRFQRIGPSCGDLIKDYNYYAGE